MVETDQPSHCYRLPCCSDARVEDPLSILEDSDADEDGLVSQWKLICVLFSRLQTSGASVHLVCDTLTDLWRTLHSDGDADLTTLRSALTLHPTFLQETLPYVTSAALELDSLFPSGTIPFLDVDTNPTINLTPRQCYSLVCHQFLGTLQCPPWNKWGGVNLYRQWYNGGENPPGIKQAYLSVLMSYLSKPPGLATDEDQSRNIAYTLRRANDLPILLHDKRHVRLDVIETENEDDLGEHHPNIPDKAEICYLVSANQFIGFGPAATQEERWFAAVPQLLPAVLVTPALSPNESLLVEGDVKIFGHFKGNLRTAQLAELIDEPARSKRVRSFLLADALELDNASEEGILRDLQPERLEREVLKLASGLSAFAPGKDIHFIAPPWGCGSFCGDIRVKLLLMWLAASISPGIAEIHVFIGTGRMSDQGIMWRSALEEIGRASPAILYEALVRMSRSLQDGTERCPEEFDFWSSLQRTVSRLVQSAG